MSDEVLVGAGQQKLQELQDLTWSQVIKKFCEWLDAEGKKGQERNFKTAFRNFLKAIGLGEESVVGPELGEEFEAKIELYVTYEISRKLSESSYGPRVSKIRALKKFVEINFASTLRKQSLPKPFGQRLLRLILLLGHTVKSFWRSLPEGLVGYKNFLNWCRDKYLPSRRHLAAIKTIEMHLEVSAGTLHLPKYLLGEHDVKVGRSDFGNKVRAALAKPYYVWTASLQEEFQGWVTHKTVAILPEGEERHERGQWTSSEGGGIPAAGIAENFLKSFMGYCALPQDSPTPYLKGQGLKLEELTIALLADKELMENYLEFTRLRSGLRVRPVEDAVRVADLPAHQISADGRWEFYDIGGKYNKSSLLTLTYISSLLRPGTGYLYQHPEFAEKLGSRMKAASWQEQCVQTRSRVEVLRKNIELMRKENNQEHYDFGRDPKEPIEWILALKRPILILGHVGPSYLSIDTLYKSAGNIPEAFLRGCGVPEDFIIYARSLTTKPIDFYSCFISYSSTDQEFADRLHSDLQTKGVPVWFAPHDMPISARIRPAIDESIRLHDKLLLVLSKASVGSQWVEQEVETALAREREPEGKTVLFPIRIDDAVMQSRAGWPALVKNSRNVGDFTHWKDHDSYREAFERLLRDLRAGA